MKKFALITLTAACLLLSACGRDADINSFIAELNTTMDEVVKKIDADPGVAGVDAAQKAFDAKKSDLKKKWDGIKDVVGFQVTATTKQNLKDAIVDKRQALNDALLRNVNAIAKDDEAAGKVQGLIREYTEMFGIPEKAPAAPAAPATPKR